MNFKGSVNKDRFAELFAIVSKYNAIWVHPPEDKGDVVEFNIDAAWSSEKEFEEAFYKLFPEKRQTVWQKIKRFLKLEGDNDARQYC